jgi:nucleotide-binding universal stress UspA family protein
MTQTTVTPADAVAFAAPATLSGPIVAAVGGFDPDSVVRTIRRLQPHSQGRVQLVMVATSPSGSVTGSASRPIPDVLIERRRTELAAALRARLQRLDGFAATWDPTILFGRPAPALADFARAARASLLVMGLGRHQRRDGVVAGATTLDTVRLARCPVLAVHPDLDSPFRCMIVATDFSAASAFAAQAALPLLAGNATVHVVHVWQPSTTSDARASTSDERYRQSLPERFRRFVSAAELCPDLEVRTVVQEGEVAACVIDYARAHHADLVVAGRRGWNTAHKVRVGSQTTALLRNIPCSLLVVPEPPASIRDRLGALLDVGGAHPRPSEVGEG